MIIISEALSRVRNQIKAVKQDAFLTDRFLYSLIMKHGQMLMRRQDTVNKLMRLNSIFQPLDFVELIEIDKVESKCNCVFSGCYIKRTKDKLPELMEGYWGPIIRSIMSLDQSEEIYPTYPSLYEKMSKQSTFKYNKTKYYWYLDGYVYFPNLSWDAVKIEGVFKGDISTYNCKAEDDCQYMQQKTFFIPEFLFTEIEQLVMRDLGIMLQIPADTQVDNKNIAR